MTIMRVKKINLTDQVYSQLKRSLLTGEWTEGTRIPSENTLCKEFSVSRVVVREALQMLRAEKLIVTRHGMGTFAANPGNFLPTNQVFNLSEESYRNFLDFRNAVEIAAVKLGSKRATESDYRRMEECLQEMSDAEDDNDRYNLADYNFHYAVVLASHNDMLIQAMAAASPALNFGTGGRPYILYRTNLNSDREMLDALLRTMKKLTEALEALQEAASEEAAKAGVTASRFARGERSADSFSPVA